ncbi:MAG: hypothetical protein AAGF87_04125 [Bacteroidota bacterium]
MPKSYLLILACFLGTYLHAQQIATLDRIYLRGGQSQVGQIIAWNEDGSLSYRDTLGQVHDLSDRDFRRVGFLRLSNGSKSLPTHNQLLNKPKSSFFRISMGFNFGRNPEPDFFNSFFQSRNSVGYQFGFQYGRRLGESFQLSAGLHYAMYRYEREERTLGPSLSLRWRINSNLQKIGLLMQAETAYEWPLGSNFLNVSDREGGLAIHPSIGVAFNGLSGVLGHFSVDLGYRFLQTAYRITQFNNSEFRQPNYRRLVARVSYSL